MGQRKLVCLVALLLAISFLGQVFAQEDKTDVNMSNIELEEFIKLVARVTNKRILYDNTLKGRKIFLISPNSVNKDELYKIFLSVIEYNGFVLEISGTGDQELIKIKRNIVGPWTATRTLYHEHELNQVQSDDQFITMVIKLNYISAREVQTTLRALRISNPQGGNLGGIEGSNTILITDFAPNVKRVYEVIKLMDQQGPEQSFKVIKLKNATADDVAEKLNDFVAKQKQASAAVGTGPELDQIKIVPDRRLNAVIVQAYQEKMVQIEKLVTELDQNLDSEPSNIHYIRLKHADATKLQETLAKVLEGGGLAQKALGETGKTSSAAGANRSITPSIQAEPQTNSLIVQADSSTWREIESIIKQVDVRRPQVLIEGALIEVSPEDMLGMGIELFWAESAQDDKVTFGGGTDFGFSNLVVVDDEGNASKIDSSTKEFTDAKKIGKVPVPTRSDFSRSFTALMNYKDVFTIPAILKAIKTEGNFKILSMPSVLTNDHEKAQIKVADAAPSQSATENNSGSRTESFSGFQEAGTTLNITPHISGETNYLRLEIEQSIDEFDKSQTSIGGVPPKRIRKIATSITVPDGQTVAIGGFTFDSQSETIEKIPLLGDLPILGLFFQTRIVNHRKRNIYLFVTPHILREESFKDLYQHSYDYKVQAHKLGANVSAVDKSFGRYMNKYGGNEKLAPIYTLEYKSKK